MIMNVKLARLAPAFTLAGWLAGVGPALADFYVDGGADSMVQPSVAAEMAVVYAGQHFTPTAVGSLGVQQGFLANDCTFGTLANCSWSPLGSSTVVDFGVSIIPLTQAQVAAYNAALGASAGPLIQFPLYGVALAIATHAPGITGNGQLVLDDGALCGIFSGQLTDWSLFSYTVPGGGFSVVYDADRGSGSTWLLTQHLHAVCDATNSAFTSLPVPVTGDFSSLPIPGGVANNPRFIAARGNGAMQKALLATGSALSYLGPPWTAIAPQSPVTAALPVAALYNSTRGVSYLPTVSATTSGLHAFGPGAVNTVAPATQAAAADPTAWVPQNPTPTKGYPIVGFANWILSSCYATVGSVVRQYLLSPYSPTTHQTIISQNGLVRLGAADSALSSAVSATLLHNTTGYNLDLQDSLTCLAYRGR